MSLLCGGGKGARVRMLLFLVCSCGLVLCGCPTEASPLTAKASPTTGLADSGLADSGQPTASPEPSAFLGNRETVCESPIAPLAAEHGGRCSQDTWNCVLNCSVSGLDYNCHRSCATVDTMPADGTVNGEPYNCGACLEAAFFPCLGANGCEAERAARDCCLEQSGCENRSCGNGDPCFQLGMTLQACANTTALGCFDYTNASYAVCFQ